LAAVTKEQIEAATIKRLAESSLVIGVHLISVVTTPTGVPTTPPGGTTFNTVITSNKEHIAAVKAAADAPAFKAGLATELGVPNLVVEDATSIVYLAVPRPAAPSGSTEVNTVSFGFNVAADAYDPAATSGPTSPAGYAAALAASLGVPVDAITVTAVQNADGTWTVTAEVDAGDDAAAAKAVKDKAEAFAAGAPAALATALGLPAGSVKSVAAPTVAVAIVAADGATAKDVVTIGFDVAANAYDPTATSGPTSPAGYAAALAASMGNKPDGTPYTAADITVTAVRNADGTWSVTAKVDAPPGGAAAVQAAANQVSAKTPAELAAALGLPAGSVTTAAAATTGVDFVAAEGTTAKNVVTLGFDVAADAYDPTATSGPTSPAGYAAALAAQMGVPAADITVTAVRNAGPPVTWSVTAKVNFGADAAAAQAKADEANSITPADLATALGLPAGSVKSIAPATAEKVFEAKPAATPPINDAAPLDDSGASNQTTAEEEMSAGIIVLILILALFVLLPLAAFFYARNKYGPGKEIDFMRYTCSHSNAAVPFLYMPKEMREDKLSALNSKPNLMNNQQEFDNLATRAAAPEGETEEEKKMRLYFEGEKI